MRAFTFFSRPTESHPLIRRQILENNPPQTRRQQKLHPTELLAIVKDRGGLLTRVVTQKTTTTESLQLNDPTSPTFAEFTPTEPTPTEPTPTEPTPTEPTPTEPTPTEPTPTEPTPSEPTPTEPTPSEPTHTESTEHYDPMSRSNSPTSTLAAIPGLKVPKPDKFDGSDMSLSTVTNWIYDIEEYMELAQVPANAQTKWAGIFLEKEAKTWYRNTYAKVRPLPALDVFLEAFKEQYLTSHGDDDIINRLEEIEQGSRMTSEYSTEFQSLVLQLGETDDRFVRKHYMRGLHWRVRNAMLPNFTGKESLTELIKHAAVISRNLEFGKSLESKTRSSSPAESKKRSSSSSATRMPSANGPSILSVNREMDSLGKFLTKLSEPEKDYLSKNKGCFNCRKINAGHIAPDCWEDHSGSGIFVKGKFLKKEFIKKEPSVSTLVVESKSDSEYSRPRSVPTIKIAAEVNGASLPSSLADCGAMINVISEDKVIEYDIPIHPMPPMQIHEPFNLNGTRVDKKVISKVRIPAEKWESQRQTEFVVAPLKEYDAVLGMPFLAEERILVDPAQSKVILPTARVSPAPSEEEDLKDDTDLDNDSEQGLERAVEEELAIEEDGKDRACDDGLEGADEVGETDMEWMKAEFPSVCPKVKTGYKLMPPRPDLAWIKDFEEFDKSESTKLREYLAKFNGIMPSDSVGRDEYFAKLNEYFIKRYTDVFAESLPDRPPHPDSPRHRIILGNENISLNGRNYRIPTRYWSKLKEFIDMHLKAGRIRPSSSHIASGTIIVPKPTDPDGMPRVVHDYRALNAETVKDHTPLPRQEDIIDCMARAVVRGKIDLVCAYYQILMEIADIHKTAFKTPFGMYEWLVMPQGLCNAVATFQRYMNWVLRDYIGKFCAVYIDDIGIWSNSVEEHAEHVRLILEKLREAGINASIKKSVLFADKIHFLGHIISSHGVEPAGTKVDKILASHIPSSSSEIKEFLGLVNYIAQFLPGLSEWSTVLSDLTRKGVKFEWLPEHDEAFCNIKRLTKNYPICKPINYNDSNPVMVVADASNRGLGGYYGQGKDYRTMVPAGFHSRAFNPAEKNYPTHDKEMLAIIDCLKKFEPHLTGIKFDILTDHAPLTHWQTQKELTPRQMRWNETLTRFDTQILHIPGISNSAADALSRYPYVQTKEEETSLSTVSLVKFDPDILQSVCASYPKDKLFAPVISHPERYPLFQLKEGLLYFEGRLCIPANDRVSREKLLKLHHDDLGNHFAVDKTRRSLMRDYYWPGIHKDVDLYIKSCVSCGRNKSPTQAPAGFLHPMPIPQNRFEELAMDFVGPLPTSNGFDTILVMTDRLTDYVKLEPTHSTATAKDIANLVYLSWYRHFGLPKAITSDRDKLFTSKFWKELHKRMKVSLRMSSSFHPETDGSSERSNKTMIESIRHYINLRQSDWVDHLIHVEAAMNNSVNSTTGKSPTEMVFGTTLRLFPTPGDLAKPTQDVPAVSEYIQRIQDSIAIARDRHAEAKTKQTTYANSKRRQEPVYKVGEKAYLETKDLRLRIKQKGRSAKFYSRYVGPFEISKAEPKTSNYTLKLPPEYQIHPKVHARRLKLAHNNDPILFPGRVPPEPPPIDADDNQYTIEAILDHRVVRKKREFLVHWEGYSDVEDSWIREMDIDPEMVKAYLEGLEIEKKQNTSPSPKI